MAYREFRNEATYKAPEIGQLLPQTMGMLDTAMKIKAHREQQNRTLNDNFKVPSAPGYLNHNTDDILNKTKFVNEKQQAWAMSGRQGLYPDARKDMAEISALSDKGKNLLDTINNIEENVSRSNDPYLKKDVIIEKAQQLRKGYLPLSEVEKGLSELGAIKAKDTFNKDKYLFDYVKEQGDIEKENDVTSRSGVREKYYDKGKWLNKDGTPTNIPDDEVVQDVIDRNPKAKQYFNDLLDDQAEKDIKSIAAGRMDQLKGEKGETLRNLIDNGDTFAAMKYIRENPEINPIDSRSDFEKISEKIKPELQNYAGIVSKSTKDYKDSNPWNKYSSIGGVNKNFEFASGYTPENGASMVALTKTGNTPSVKGANPSGLVKNSITGQVSKIGGSGSDVSINDWHIGVVDSKGIPVNIPGKTLEESINYIKTAPIEEVRKWKEITPIVRGTILNKASTIDAKQRLQKEYDKLKVATDKTPEEQAEFQKLADMIGADAIDLNDEVVQKYLGDMVSNVTYKMDKVTSGNYEARTGIDPLNAKALTPEMKEMKGAIESRIREARPLIEQQDKEEAAVASQRAKAMEPYKPEKKVYTAKKPPMISSQADYDALPSGSVYLDAEGNQRKKK